jgi:hypothetical protein
MALAKRLAAAFIGSNNWLLQANVAGVHLGAFEVSSLRLVLGTHVARVFALKSAALTTICFATLYLLDESVHLIEHCLAFLTCEQFSELMPIPLMVRLLLHPFICRSVLHSASRTYSSFMLKVSRSRICMSVSSSISCWKLELYVRICCCS